MKKALAKYHGVKPSEIILGNGSNEIIELLVRGFVSPGDSVVSSDMTFLVYPLVTQIAGGKYVQKAMKTFRYDLPALEKSVDKKTRIVFIANPNNPTGSYVTDAELELFIESVPKDTIVCLDEAYVDFVEAKDFPKSLKYLKKELADSPTFSRLDKLSTLEIKILMNMVE